MNPGHVKACHNPHNELCPHNADLRFDCTCKSGRVVTRKPFRKIIVTLRPEALTHRMRAKMVVEVGFDGTLRLRELGRRRIYETNVGKVYTGCVWREAMLSAQAHKAARKAKKVAKKRR